MKKCVPAVIAVIAMLVNAVIFTCYGVGLYGAAVGNDYEAAGVILVGLAFLWLASIVVIIWSLFKGCYSG